MMTVITGIITDLKKYHQDGEMGINVISENMTL